MAYQPLDIYRYLVEVFVKPILNGPENPFDVTHDDNGFRIVFRSEEFRAFGTGYRWIWTCRKSGDMLNLRIKSGDTYPDETGKVNLHARAMRIAHCTSTGRTLISIRSKNRWVAFPLALHNLHHIAHHMDRLYGINQSDRYFYRLLELMLFNNSNNEFLLRTDIPYFCDMVYKRFDVQQVTNLRQFLHGITGKLPSKEMVKGVADIEPLMCLLGNVKTEEDAHRIYNEVGLSDPNPVALFLTKRIWEENISKLSFEEYRKLQTGPTWVPVEYQSVYESAERYVRACLEAGITPNIQITSIRRMRILIEHHSRAAALISAPGVTPSEKYPELPKTERFAFALIRGKKMLLRHAVRQSNCVAGYWEKINSGDCAIYIVRDRERKEIYTMVVTPYYGNPGILIMSQLLGRFNHELPSDVHEAVKAASGLKDRRYIEMTACLDGEGYNKHFGGDEPMLMTNPCGEIYLGADMELPRPTPPDMARDFSVPGHHAPKPDKPQPILRELDFYHPMTVPDIESYVPNGKWASRSIGFAIYRTHTSVAEDESPRKMLKSGIGRAFAGAVHEALAALRGR